MKRRARAKAVAPAQPPKLVLVLYVAGSSPNSVAAITNLRKLQAGPWANRLELEIVDVFLHSERASTDGVLVTPTLIKLSPLPGCRILGNLNDTDLVLRTLGFDPEG